MVKKMMNKIKEFLINIYNIIFDDIYSASKNNIKLNDESEDIEYVLKPLIIEREDGTIGWISSKDVKKGD